MKIIFLRMSSLLNIPPFPLPDFHKKEIEYRYLFTQPIYL